MGYAVFGAKSVPQLQRHIRSIAADTGAIFITTHAKGRMRKRHVSVNEVFECLRTGTISRQPEPNPSKGSLECRMQRYIGGRECAVVVALCDEDPTLIVVTVLI